MINLSIKTERLNLRPFIIDDAPRVRVLCGAWAVSRMLARLPYPYPPGLAEEWIGTHDEERARGQNFPFAVTLQNRLIGAIGLFKSHERAPIELGYWVAVSYWGFGYATEAARAMLEFAFVWLGLPALQASHFAENEASARVLRKLGFVETGRGLHNCIARKADIPGVELELTRDLWRETRL